MKTFILAFFGLLALANAQRPPIYRKPPHAWNLEEEDVYDDPGRVHPELTKAYADPGYEQPAKYVQFKLNYSGISCSILFA